MKEKESFGERSKYIPSDDVSPPKMSRGNMVPVIGAGRMIGGGSGGIVYI